LDLGHRLITSTAQQLQWLGMLQFPTAGFTAKHFAKTDDDAYTAYGTALPFPFMLTTNGLNVKVHANLPLFRKDFEITTAVSNRTPRLAKG